MQELQPTYYILQGLYSRYLDSERDLELEPNFHILQVLYSQDTSTLWGKEFQPACLSSEDQSLLGAQGSVKQKEMERITWPEYMTLTPAFTTYMKELI